MVALGFHCCVQASSCGEQGATLSCSARASHCNGFSCCGAQALGCSDPVVVVHRMSCLRHVGSSWTRDQTGVCCIGRWILNQWTTREVPLLTLFIISCPALPLCSPPVATLFSSLYFQISPPENSTSGPLHGVFLGYSSHTQFLILSSQFKCPLSSKSPSAALSEAGPAVSTVIHSHQFSSVTQLCLTLVTPWTAARQASLSITNSQFIQIYVH